MGQGQVPGWRGRPQRRSARARPRNARPPGSSRRRRRRRRLNNPESMRRKSRNRIEGREGEEDRAGTSGHPLPPLLAPPTSRAPSPSSPTWANNGGKGGPGLGWRAQPWEAFSQNITGVLCSRVPGRLASSQDPSNPLKSRPASRPGVRAEPRLWPSPRGPPTFPGRWGEARPAWGEGETAGRAPASARGRGRGGRGESPGLGSPVGRGPRPSPSPTGPWPRAGGIPAAAAGGTRASFVPPPQASKLRGRAAGAAGPGRRAGGVPGSGRAGTNTSRARREAQGRPERAR